MKLTHILFIAILVIIPLTIYSIGRADIVGVDEYYNAQYVCKHNMDYMGNPLFGIDLPKMLLYLFPCNFFAMKALMFFLCFVSLLAIAWFGEQFDKENGWLAAPFAFLTPLLIIEFSKFNPNEMSYPLLFLSIPLVWKFKKSHDVKYFILAGICLLLGGLFWQGSYYIMVAVSTFDLLMLIPLSQVTIFFFDKIFYFLGYSKFNLVESQPFIGIIFLFFLTIGFLALPIELILPTIILSIIGISSVKFAALIIPFLSVGVMNFSKFSKNWKDFLLTFAIIFSFAWGFILLGYPPSSQNTEAVNFAINQANGSIISNDWDTGHWINYYGGHAKYSAAPFDENYTGISLSRKYLPCKILKEFGDYNVYRCTG